jgi:hypothetical protein
VLWRGVVGKVRGGVVVERVGDGKMERIVFKQKSAINKHQQISSENIL